MRKIKFWIFAAPLLRPSPRGRGLCYYSLSPCGAKWTNSKIASPLEGEARLRLDNYRSIPLSTPPERSWICGRCSGTGKCSWRGSSGSTRSPCCPPHSTTAKIRSWERNWSSIPLQGRYLFVRGLIRRCLRLLLCPGTSLSLIGLTVPDSVNLNPYLYMLLLHRPSNLCRNKMNLDNIHLFRVLLFVLRILQALTVLV